MSALKLSAFEFNLFCVKKKKKNPFFFLFTKLNKTTKWKVFFEASCYVMGCLFVRRFLVSFYPNKRHEVERRLLRARGVQYLLCCELTDDMFKNACHDVLQGDPQVEYSLVSHQYIFFLVFIYLLPVNKERYLRRLHSLSNFLRESRTPPILSPLLRKCNNAIKCP